MIYVQRYVNGALHAAFFSDSLLPLLGWTLAECSHDSLASLIHPEDRDLYFERTRQLLREGAVRSRYRLRKQIVEPVFGQIKQARGFRQFLLRGVEKVRAEWALICTTHNLLKLFTLAKAA